MNMPTKRVDSSTIASCEHDRDPVLPNPQTTAHLDMSGPGLRLVQPFNAHRREPYRARQTVADAQSLLGRSWTDASTSQCQRPRSVELASRRYGYVGCLHDPQKLLNRVLIQQLVK